MAVTKPTTVPTWATAGTRTNPGGAKILTGWVEPELPPDAFFNWLQGFSGDWLEWINERMVDGGSNADFRITPPNVATTFIEMVGTESINIQVAGLDAGEWISAGLRLPNGLAVGGDGTLTPSLDAQRALQIVQPGFIMGVTAGDPSIHFDGLFTGLRYDIGTQALQLRQGDVTRMVLDFNNSRFFPNVTATGAVGVETAAWAEIWAERIAVTGVGGDLASKQQPVNTRYERLPNNSPMCVVRVNGSDGALEGDVRWNVASSTRTSTGAYTVNFTESPASSVYSAFANAIHLTADGIAVATITEATFFRMQARTDNGSTVDVDCCGIVYG